MRNLKKYESFIESYKQDEPVNEEFIGKLLAAAKGALKNFLGNITEPMKKLKDDFKKGMKAEELKKKMTTTVDTILKSATDNINKAEDENAINQIKDAFRKEIDEKVVEFDKDIKAVKESKFNYDGIVNEGLVKDTMIGARVAIGMLKDIAGKVKADYDKKFAAAKDLAAKKAVAVEEIKKIADDFKKTINDENAFKAAEEKYMKDNKIEGGGGGGPKIVLDWGDVEVELSPLSGEEQKKHPGYYKIVKSGSKKIVVKEGETVLAKISGTVKKGEKAKMTDILRNDKPDALKEYQTGSLEKITVDDKEVPEYKFGEEKAGEDDLAAKVGELKSKKPEDAKKVSNFVDFISDEKNKDKVGEIEKIIGGEGGE